jgi:cytochrome c553
VRIRVTLTWLRIVIGLLACLVAAVAGALLIAWTGLYSLAASHGHPGWMTSFLEFGKRRSIIANTRDLNVPDLDDPNLIRLGAAHFDAGCAVCHGAPGRPVTPVFEAMLPVPPPLSERAQDWSPEELHWVVRHGLQFTGMPGWSGEDRDDEVWAMVAFLRALSDLTPAAYGQLAAGNAPQETADVDALVTAGPASLPMAACAKCHGSESAPPTSDLVPILSGQSPAALEIALNDYRSGARESGFMEPVAGQLSEDRIGAIAAYLSSRESLAYAGTEATDPDAIARGRELARRGDGDRLAACDSCHGGSARADYPRLNGQSAVYIRAQLQLWKEGGRAVTPHGRLMAEITDDLSEGQITDIAAYYASQPVFQYGAAVSPAGGEE